MFIRYTGTNVHALGLINKTGLKLNQSPQQVIGLQPGWNEVPKDLWEQNKNQPDVKNMLARGKLEVLKDQVIVKFKDKKGNFTKKKIAIGEHDKPLSLSHFNPERAIEIVKETFKRDILQRWEDEETRIKVRKALAKQIKPLLNTKSDEEDESASTEEEYYE